MKKRFLIALIAFVCAVACALSLAACGGRPGGGDGNNPGGGNNAEYTVVFDANGGKFEKGDIELDEDVTLDDGTVISADGTKMTLTTKLTTLTSPLRNPERDRYALCGWALDKEGETLWDFDSDTLKGDITLYAVWAVTFDYALSEDSSYYVVRGIGGLSGDVEIPEIHNGKPVKAIAKEAFKNSRSLTGIIIPDSVTEIGVRAFMNATKLESVKIGEGITQLPDEVLKDCEELEVLYLPKSLKEIKYTAFGIEGQKSLVEVHYAGKADDWCAIEMDCSTDNKANPLANGKAELYIDGKVVTEVTLNTETVGRWAFYNYGSLKTVKIGNGVKRIEDAAFCSAGVSELTFANDAALTSIGSSAFSGIKITSLVLPDKLTELGKNAFYDCGMLASVNLGGVKYVGASAFENCYALTTVDLGQAEELGDHAFASYEPEAKLTAVTIPDTVWYMGSGCFSEQSKLNSVTFESNQNSASWQVTTVRGYNQETETVTSDALTAPAQNARRIKENGVWVRIAGELNFSETNGGEEYTVTGVKNKDGRGALVIPEKHNDKPVTAIGDSAFADFAGLRSVSIPASVESIGSSWISGCKLTSISVAPNSTHYGSYDGIFYEKNGSILWVSSGIGTTRASGWVDIPYGVKTIPSKAFAGLNIWGVEIPDSVTSVSDSAFEGCPITMVTVPAFAISAIPKDKLETVVITSGNTIEAYDFKNAKNLASLVLPYDLKTIGKNAFENCYGLSELTIPDSVTRIYDNAFLGCSGLTLYTSVKEEDCVWSYSGCPVVYGGSGGVANDGYMYVIIDGVRYALKDGEATVAKQPGDLTFVTVPASVKYKEETYPVTKIAEGAFDNCVNLVSITVSSKVDGYSSYSGILYNKDKTEIVCVPGGIRGSVVIPKGVTKIDGSVFEICDNLTGIEVEYGNTSYASQDGVLYNKDKTQLIFIPRGKTSVVIADGVKIYRQDLEKCSGLASVVVGANPDDYVSENGILYNSDKTKIVFVPNAIKGDIVIPDSVTVIGQSEFSGRGGITSVTIGKSVTSIGYSAFSGCGGITSVTIPGSVTSIGDSAFSDCGGLTSLTIVSGVTSIGNSAFYGCSSLTSVNIPSSVTSIGDSVFSNCADLEIVYWNATACTSAGSSSYPIFDNCNKLKTVVIGDNVTAIPYSAFAGCSGLTSITIPGSVTSIGNSAFYGCSGLTSITIPGSVTSIGNSAFYGCSGLTSITIPNSVTSIGYSAFYGCNELTSVTLSDNVTRIGQNAFARCSGLTSITIPEGVTSIGDSAFYGCSGLTSINIPNSVTSIGDDAFYECSDLASVTIGNSVASIGLRAFYGCDRFESITLPNSVTSIASCAFYGCSGLTSITIPSSVTSIGSAAFNGCSGLTSIYYTGNIKDWCGIGGLNNLVIYVKSDCKLYIDNVEITDEFVVPDDVTSIGEYAFYGRNSLKSVTIPDSVTKIGQSAFSGCDGLTEVTIGNGVTYIAGYAFENCSSLADVTVPDSVTVIGRYAFFGCSGLTSITLPFTGSTKGGTYDPYFGYIFGAGSHGSNASYVPKALKSVVITGGDNIGEYAFDGISGLTSVTIGDGVTSIKRNAFKGCSGLTSVTIGSGVTSIGYEAFSDCDDLAEVYYTGDIKGWCGISEVRFLMNYGKSDRKLYIDDAEVAGELVIPEGVTNIYDSAFCKCSGLESITVPDSVESIGISVFYGCSSLTSITLPFVGAGGERIMVTHFGYIFGASSYDSNSIYVPQSLKSVVITGGDRIGYSAFSGCGSLTSITLPYVGYSATSDSEEAILGYIFGKKSYSGSTAVMQYFYNVSTNQMLGNTYFIPSSLKSVTVTGGEIVFGAFYGISGLTSVTIGDGVTSIGKYAFYGCSGLTSIYYTGDIASWCKVSGLNYLMSSSRILYIGGQELTGELVIPDGVTSIGNSAFEGCVKLTSVTIPDGVTSIGEYAFRDCSRLTSITIGNSVTGIGSGTFEGCSSLTGVTIPNGVTGIGDDAFRNCSGLTSVTIPNSVTGIGDDAFRNCSGLTSVTIPDGVTSIGEYAFRDCSRLTSITIPNSVTSIGDDAFWGCGSLQYNEYDNALYLGNSDNPYVVLRKAKNTGITSCQIHSNTRFIDQSAFSYCSSLTSITIPNSVTSIGKYAFSGCSSLESVTIGNSVTSIGEYAFRNCSSLTSITIPNSVTSIGSSAFDGCNKLTIYCEAESKPDEWENDWNSDRPVVWGYKNS